VEHVQIRRQPLDAFDHRRPPAVHEKVATLSTESIASSSPPAAETAERCTSCGALLATDQRYCLQCGERHVPVSDFLRAGSSPAAQHSTPAGSSPPAFPPAGSIAGAAQHPRNNMLSVIAGVGVLLLAMGVGVLIGRAGQSKQAAAPAEVITVGASTAAGTRPAEEALTDDWPSGTKGYTVQLEKLPSEGTTVKAVEQAKTEAGTKGASSVGGLKSEDFSSLTSGSYIIYSGIYHKRAEAQKALGDLKKKFPGATVIEISNGSDGSGSKASTGSKGGSGVGASESNPAPPSVLESLKSSKGKSYEEKSKALPDVVSTG
jgi:hypothetical protein